MSKLTDQRHAKIALDATELLLAYHTGKPTQTVTPDGADGSGRLVIQWLSE